MLVIYLLTVCFTEGNSVVIDIPENVGTMCPYSDICNRSATTDLKTVEKWPCCQECSCDSTCGLRLNCCFEEHDTYRLVERGLVACIEPLEGNVDLITTRRSFHMIQACYDKDLSLNKLCRTRDELGNSLIAPVSSTDKGYIYINDECAKCNGLLDTKAWKALLVYDASKHYLTYQLDFRDSLLANISTLVYKPPAEEGWHKMQCFKHFFPANCKNSEWNKLCAYLNAPYTDTYNTVYRNVYCRKCYGAAKFDLECEAYADSFSFYSTFTLLMNTEAIGNLKQKNNIESHQSLKGKGCVKEFEKTVQDDCLRVYCPEGQTETTEGCKYVGLWWYIKFFLMQVKLVPSGNKRLSVSSLLQIGITEKNNPFSWIKPGPCMKLKLTDMAVYYERAVNTSDKEHVRSLIVVFGRKTVDNYGIDPSVVIPLMKQCIDNTWLVNINETTYQFSASLDEYLDYVQDGKQLHLMFSVEENLLILQTKPDPASFELLASRMDNAVDKDFTTGFGVIWLRKSFFCKQVRFSIDELEFEYGRIKIRSKNITIGSNKYTINSKYYLNKEGKVKDVAESFSVCLDDYLSDNTSHSTSCKKQSGFMIMLCTIVSLQFVINTRFSFKT